MFAYTKAESHRGLGDTKIKLRMEILSDLKFIDLYLYSQGASSHIVTATLKRALGVFCGRGVMNIE